MDENFLMTSVSAFFSNRTIIPVETVYPTLFSICLRPLLRLLFHQITFLGARSFERLCSLLKQIMAEFVIGARFLSFSMLVLIVMALGIFLRRRFSAVAAFVSLVLLMSVEPLVRHASYALPDLLMVALTLASFLTLVWPYTGSNGPDPLSRTIVRHVFAGLAISSKYNGVAAALLVAFSTFE